MGIALAVAVGPALALGVYVGSPEATAAVAVKSPIIAVWVLLARPAAAVAVLAAAVAVVCTICVLSAAGRVAVAVWRARTVIVLGNNPQAAYAGFCAHGLSG